MILTKWRKLEKRKTKRILKLRLLKKSKNRLSLKIYMRIGLAKNLGEVTNIVNK
jgi:hypothetical protein